MHCRLTGLFSLFAIVTLVACAAPEPPSPDAPDEPTTTPIPLTSTTLTPIPAPVSTTIVETYTVRYGDTLGAIAARYDLSIEDLMRLNGLTNPNALQIGQVLKIQLQVTRGAPADFLLPDSEVVYGPAYAMFDVSGFANQANGYLASYREKVEGELLSGPQIIQLVAERFSVGPRVLLALLELQSHWVTDTTLSQSQITYAMGLQDPTRQGLFYQTSWAANHLNEGYYGKISGRLAAYRFKDRTRARVAPTINPGSTAIQNVLALTTNWETWLNQIGPSGLPAAYNRLFGDPATVAMVPLLPPGLKQPSLRLPWSDGNVWYYTGGPHSPWGDLAAWAAIDLTPSDIAGSGSCYASRDWAVAAAPGQVVRSGHGRVVVALNNGNFQGNGWALLYMHLAPTGRVSAGTQINTGDRLGHPSCEGGDANASHIHFARLYNGQWIDPETVPFVLSGWQITSSTQPYEGNMSRGSETREAQNGRVENKNTILADGGR